MHKKVPTKSCHQQEFVTDAVLSIAYLTGLVLQLGSVTQTETLGDGVKAGSATQIVRLGDGVEAAAAPGVAAQYAPHSQP